MACCYTISLCLTIARSNGHCDNFLLIFFQIPQDPWYHNKNNKSIYTMQICQGCKCTSGRQFWKGTCLLPLWKYPVVIVTVSSACLSSDIIVSVIFITNKKLNLFPIFILSLCLTILLFYRLRLSLPVDFLDEILDLWDDILSQAGCPCWWPNSILLRWY